MSPFNNSASLQFGTARETSPAPSSRIEDKSLRALENRMNLRIKQSVEKLNQ